MPASLRARLARFERHFDEVLPAADEPPVKLHSAMRWSAVAPGKRVRALLALTACEALGAPFERALPAAAAVECVHAFSLVHDDLPAMDDDDYRRGRLTTHKKFGDAYGVLAGDALLALAFEELARLGAHGVKPAEGLRAVEILARASGSRELVGGQAFDLEAEGRRVNGEAVRQIHLRKTGALIAASLVLGAIAAGARPARLAKMESLGRRLGLAFQIHDDLLNRSSSLARLGKRAGTDEARRKATYPRAVGERPALEAATGLYLEALEEVRRMGSAAGNLGVLILAVAERDR